MNKPSNPLTLEECKIQASILLKTLRASDLSQANKAAKRFQRLPELKELSLTEIIQADVKRKHALAIIAIEKGFKSWINLKCQLPFIRGGFLNKWFANYTKAKSHLLSDGGFLFPYKNQFFICEAEYIKYIGLNPNDSDWKLIHWDWAQPSDKTAWQRLYKKWMQIQGGGHE